MPAETANNEHQSQSKSAADRGRDADSPREIPARGWKDIIARVRVGAKEDDVTLMAAGVAFYSLMALVPGLVALISIYGLVAKPSDVKDQITSTLSAAPREVRDLATAQLEAIVSSAGGGAVLGNGGGPAGRSTRRTHRCTREPPAGRSSGQLARSRP